jgi:acetyl esterase/lipase
MCGDRDPRPRDDMPIGYLITVLLAGVGTYCALWPRSLPGLATYRIGLVLNEVPFIAVYWLLASTLLALQEGDLSSAGGRIGLALTAVVLLGLGALVRRSLAGRAVLADVLPDALGFDWRAEVDPQRAAELRQHLPLARATLFPFRRRRGDVERIANISYGPAGRVNTLDIYRHRSRPAGSPVFVHLHGGRFVSGAKNRESLPLLYRLASRGWLCISANYRLGPDASFPNPLIDGKRVLAWVRDHGSEYGADPAVVFVAGDSAGAWIAASAALTPNRAEYQPGFEPADTSVTGAICLYGYYGRTEATESASSPIESVTAGAPPFLVIHGDLDSVTPVAGGRQLAESLRRGSRQPVAYAELPGAQHTFDYFRSIRCELTVDLIEDFTAYVRAKNQVRAN